MHSSTYRVEEAKYSTMHMDLRPEPEKFTVHHNGDYSGDVWIETPIERVEFADSDVLGSTTVTVKIPYDLLEQIVMTKLRDDLISKVEQMDLDTFKKFLQEVF